MKRISLLLTATALMMSNLIVAQDSAKKSNTTISGSVDAYYRYNFANAKDDDEINNWTSFTNSHNSFELGMASVKLEHTMGKAGGVIDLGFGRRAEEFSYNDEGTLAAIKQAYVYFAPSEHVKFTFGKWGTHVGYEVVDAYVNRNYSMAYMFSYGPFFHTGLKADFTFNNFGFMLGVANPTDFVSASFQKKFILGQVSAGTPGGNFKGYLNYVGGKDAAETSINQVDLVLTGIVTPQFSLGYNGTVQLQKPDAGDRKSWWGSALYVNVDPTPMFGFCLRGEYFDDKKGASGLAAATGSSTSVFAGTLSLNIKVDNLTIIPEFRFDNSKEMIFLKNNGDAVKGTGSFILAATYHF
jgi:hypothetical protein